MATNAWSLAFALALVACGGDYGEQAGTGTVNDANDGNDANANKLIVKMCDESEDQPILFPPTGISVQTAYRSISVVDEGPSAIYGPEDVTYTIDGPDAAEFETLQAFSACSFDQVPQQTSCHAVLVFRPTTRGAKQAVLRVTYPFTDLATGTVMTRDETFAITATAVSAPTTIYASSTRLFVTADPNVVITNPGAYDVANNGGAGVDNGFSLQGHDCESVLAAGASCTVFLNPRFSNACATGSLFTAGLIIPLEAGAP